MFCFTDLFSLSILLRFFVRSTCDVLHKTEETIRMRILAYFASLFTTLMNSKNFKMTFLVFTLLKLYICPKKSAVIFPCPPPFNYFRLASAATSPIVQVHAYICLPRLLHLLSLPSLLYLANLLHLFSVLSYTYIASYLCMSTFKAFFASLPIMSTIHN